MAQPIDHAPHDQQYESSSYPNAEANYEVHHIPQIGRSAPLFHIAAIQRPVIIGILASIRSDRADILLPFVQRRDTEGESER